MSIPTQEPAPRLPLITRREFDQMAVARSAHFTTLDLSLDLQLTQTTIDLGSADFGWQGGRFSYPARCKERTVYFWAGAEFKPALRYSSSLIKLVPTEWGAPTFEIDGVKMLPTAQLSPYVDAERKVGLIEPCGKTILDTCGGLGYFASWCVRRGAARVQSYEKNSDVIWLRSINPWSPPESASLTLIHADVIDVIPSLASNSVDAILHDPPRFGTAGDLYSQNFYDQLARVVKRKGRLFHYTGNPNALSSGRNVPNEISNRLRTAGFAVQRVGDGVLAVRR